MKKKSTQVGKDVSAVLPNDRAILRRAARLNGFGSCRSAEAPSRHHHTTLSRCTTAPPSPAQAQSSKPRTSPNNASSHRLPHTAVAACSPERAFSQRVRLRLHTHRGNESAGLTAAAGVMLAWCDTPRKACGVVWESFVPHAVYILV
ncbi:hypothetical protein PSPO01_12002 [Paraphaeosphaeria sporulosa]